MLRSVGHAWAVLKGKRSGDPMRAYEFLSSMSPAEYRRKNRAEGKVRARIKAKPLKVGQSPRTRWST